MSRSHHDQYGTHDDYRRPPRRSAAQRRGDEQAAGETKPDPGGKTPNYGSGRERAGRTTGGSNASFEGRDFERENYGGGYGVQRKTRDVPAAGRKGEWMQDGRRPDRPARG